MQIAHGDKILFPESKITKRDLIGYYEKIADWMLPFLKGRPLTMHRFPDGISKEGFYQKNASEYFPDWIKTESIQKEGGWVNHVVCENQNTITYLAGLGTITFHVALSKIDKLDYPDKLIFDLDPPDDDFALTVKGAKKLRIFLEKVLGLSTYVMLTGSRGLHVTVPLCRAENFDEVRDFAKKAAGYLADQNPDGFTTAIRKGKRGGRLFFDYLRNSYAQTAVCPYSVRAFEGAPVATPIDWEELDDPAINSRSFNIHTIFDRLRDKGNPWKNFDKDAVMISNAKKKLEKLIGGTLGVEIASFILTSFFEAI